jgi:hypothetical protein
MHRRLQGMQSSHPRSSHPEPAKKFAGGPVSRILSRTAIPLDAALLPTFISDLPGGFRCSGLRHRRAHVGAPGRHATAGDWASLRSPSLFGLAPCGVYPASGFTAGAVRSYRTFSPLPRACARWRYVLCGTSRPGALTRRSRTLSGTLPCGVRTFLPRATSARQRPSSPPAWVILTECHGCHAV